jgi:HlyD family secretion protein
MINQALRAIAIAVLAAAVGGVGVAYFGPSVASAYAALSGRTPIADYETEVVRRGSISETVAATGTVQPVASILVGTQVSGQISEINADFNTVVTKGDVIARIDPLPFQIEVERAEAEVRIAEAALLKAQVGESEAARDEQRKRKLTMTGAASVVEQSKAMTASSLAAADVRYAAATVGRAKAALRQSRLNLERTQIRSPVDGVITQRNVEQGQTVAAELQAPTLFVIAQDLRQMQVELSVDEADIGNIDVAQPVTFTVDTFPGRQFSGKVAQIRKYPVMQQNVTTYVVIVSAPNPDLALLPGLTALATITVTSKDDVLKVPSAALRFRPANVPFSGPAVWVVGASGLAERRVNVGLSTAAFVEVAGRLREGEEVAIGTKTAPEHAEGLHWTFGGLR